MLVTCAPVADAESDDAAQEQTFVGDRIEDHAERAPLVVASRDETIDAVAGRGEKKDRDRSEALPMLGAAFLDALPIINRQRNEHGDHQDPDYGDFVGGCHRDVSRS